MSLESAAETCRDPWCGALASCYLIALSSASVLRSSPNGRPTGCLERGQAVLTLSVNPVQQVVKQQVSAIAGMHDRGQAA
jgi:hypothetical protein